MATKLTAARQLTRYAAERYDSGERCDMEAGMAKLFASEVAMEIALNAVRIHGGYGYSTEFDVERYFRDAPLMIVGEGTNEIQRNVIAGAAGGPRRDLAVKTEPAYQTLREQLRDEIAAGRYRDGVRLPTESELVARHRLSRQTVRRAFQDLVAEGVVYRVPGRGTYASEPGRRYLRQLGSIEDLMSLSDDTSMEVLAGLRRRVDVDAASRLRLDDDIVYTVVFRRLHDGVPFVLTVVHLPESVAQPVLGSPSWRTAPSAPTPSSACWNRSWPSRSTKRRNRLPSPRPTTSSRARSGANPGTRCCAWTGSTPTLPAGPSSCRSATSCPSSTPTASRCVDRASGGIGLPRRQPHRQPARVPLAGREDIGFDQVFVPDHCADLRNRAGPWFDRWSLLPTATYEGRWLQARVVATSPGSIQRPRPTLITGGQSPTVLWVSAERADVWNTHGPIVDDAVQILETTVWQNRHLDELCLKIGRTRRHFADPSPVSVHSRSGSATSRWGLS